MDKAKKISMLIENFKNLNCKAATKVSEYLVNEATIGNINNLLDTRLEYYAHDDLIIISWTYFKIKLDYSGWDDPTYCTIQKMGHSNKVADYHHQSVIIFKVTDDEIRPVGRNDEKKLFRTTDAGVVAERYSNNVVAVEQTESVVIIKYDDGTLKIPLAL